MLSLLNAHERDARVRFDEAPHKYYIDGSSEGYTSVTTFIHQLFPHFNADVVISKMLKGKNWETSKWHGMTRQEIKAAWDANGKAAAASGTLMHANIEHYYNLEPHETLSEEWKLFANFLQARPLLKPFRTEMIVYAEELKLAGSIDMIYHDPDEEGAYLIYDW